MAKITSSVAPADVTALADILDRLVGTPLERTGDISIVLGTAKFVIKRHDGSAAVVEIERP